MKKIKITILSLLVATFCNAQFVENPTGVLSTTDNVQTQGAIKVKSYLLFDADGDFTGGNYYSMEDHTGGNYLRFGYGFNDNLIINSVGNIGIGTSSPVGDGLTIVGGDTGQDFLTLDRPNIGKFRFNAGGYNTRVTLSSGNIDQFSIGYDGTKGGLAFTKDIEFSTHGHAVFIKNDGYVGIGNSNPQYLLDASGNIRAQQHLITGGVVSNGRVYIRDINSNQKILLQSDGDSYFNSGNVGIGTTSPNYPLSVRKDNGVSNTIHPLASFSRLTSGTGNAGLNISYEANGSATTRTLLYFPGGLGASFQVYNQGALDVLHLDPSGNVGIGTTNPQSKLAVDGQIRATEVKVLADITVPDYVFEPSYELRTLQEIKKFITDNKHLPEIPSASEISESGIDLGDMNMRLLKKIEELTLYQIELLEKVEELQNKVEKLENK